MPYRGRGGAGDDGEHGAPGLGARLRATRRSPRRRARRGRPTSRRRPTGPPTPEPAGGIVGADVSGPVGEPGGVLVLPEARDGLWTRGRPWAVLLACFLGGGAVGTAAYPWIAPALARATDEIRAVAEAGFTHSTDRAAFGARPEGVPP